MAPVDRRPASCASAGCSHSESRAVAAATRYRNYGPGTVARYAPSRCSICPSGALCRFWQRFLAYFIDNVLLGIVFGIFALLVVAIVGVGYFRTIFEGLNGEDSTIPVAFISLILLASALSLAITWVYYAWMESSNIRVRSGKWRWG